MWRQRLVRMLQIVWFVSWLVFHRNNEMLSDTHLFLQAIEGREDDHNRSLTLFYQTPVNLEGAFRRGRCPARISTRQNGVSGTRPSQKINHLRDIHPARAAKTAAEARPPL